MNHMQLHRSNAAKTWIHTVYCNACKRNQDAVSLRCQCNINWMACDRHKNDPEMHYSSRQLQQVETKPIQMIDDTNIADRNYRRNKRKNQSGNIESSSSRSCLGAVGTAHPKSVNSYRFNVEDNPIMATRFPHLARDVRDV